MSEKQGKDEKLDKKAKEEKNKEEKIKEESSNKNQEEIQGEEIRLPSDSSEIESRNKEIEELKIKLKETEDKFLRTYAECENIRKRSDKERREILKLANKSLLSSLIGFMDDFERALKAGSEHEEIKNDDFYKGIELIHKRFSSFLEDNGVKELKSLGEEFNPNIHEALSVIEKEDLKEETVVDVYMKGYTLNDEILRTAKVIIGKPKS